MRISLAEAAPELCKEWSEKNAPLTPLDVTNGSNRKVWWRGKCGHEWEAIVKNRVRNHGCPVCSGNKLLSGFNDFATACADLTVEWSERNHPLTPDQVHRWSNRVVWWICRECGHEWKARIADRAEGHGCPACMKSGKLFCGENDLQTLYPAIACEWSDRNGLLQPSMVKPLSVKNVWWKCRECGHEWQAMIRTRIAGKSGCPNCAHQNVLLRRMDISPKAAFLYYAEKGEVDVCANDERDIGIPLDLFFPSFFAAIIFSDWKHNKPIEHKRQYAINTLCKKRGILLIRIMNSKGMEFDNCVCVTKMDDSDEALTLAISTVFRMLCIDLDIDVERDREDILRYDGSEIECAGNSLSKPALSLSV